MKFGQIFRNAQVPEWKDAYFDYKVLKKLISPFKIKSRMYIIGKIEEGRERLKFKTLKNKQMKYLKEFNSLFDQIILMELEKINAFFQYKYMDLRKKWDDIQKDIRLKQLEKKIKRLKKNKKLIISKRDKNLRYQFDILFREIIFFENYVKLNNTAMIKLKKKCKKIFEKQQFENIFYRVEQRQSDSYIQRNAPQIYTLQSQVETKYIQAFFGDDLKTQKEGRKKLRQISQAKGLSQKDSFIFGLFLGFSILFLGWIILLFVKGTLDADDGTDKSPTDEIIPGKRFEYIFPLFRGPALFILYMWLLSLNMAGWNKFHVNYKLIFKFTSHFSQITQVLRRAAIFTMVYLFFFIWYILVQHDKSTHILPALDWFPQEYCPIFVWVLMITYLVFPFRRYFNFKGRRFMWRLLLKCFKQPFTFMEFSIAWMTDQLISLGGAFKDLEYTACYYIYDVQKHNTDQEYVCPGKHRPTAFILSIIPLYLRAVQCIRQCWQEKNFRTNPQMINFGKYMSSIIASSLSFIVKRLHEENSDLEDSFFVLWLIFAGFTTVYSYCWDLKKDWGLIEPGQKGLRKDLMYQRKSLYYIAIFNNLILRLVWVISISPDVKFALGISGEMWTFLVVFLELFRRCQWNFLRVEKEHIANLQNYKAVLSLQLEKPIQKQQSIQQNRPSQIQQRQIIQQQSPINKLQKVIEEQQNDTEQLPQTERNNFKEDSKLIEPSNNNSKKHEEFEAHKNNLIYSQYFQQVEQQQQQQNSLEQQQNFIVDNTFKHYKTVLQEYQDSFQFKQIKQNLKEFKDEFNKKYGATQYQFYTDLPNKKQQ